MAAALTATSGLIHLHLYDLGYRRIPTVGVLFLAQGIGSIVLAVVGAWVRRVWSALVGAADMLATLAGFLISVNYGLFGFQDAFDAPDALGAFAIEIASAVFFVVTATLSLALRARPAGAVEPDGPDRRFRSVGPPPPRTAPRARRASSTEG